MAAANGYTSDSIKVLKDLEPVRVRPGMFIGGTGKMGLHHLLWEIVDNSVDEAINGYATTIEVALHEDRKTMTVGDNGRGIPVGLHPEEHKSTLEVILTTLHAGAKFVGEQYITSGGLHGVGSSVVNALSEMLVARVRRDGKLYEQSYVRGIPQGDVAVVGVARGTGTEVVFRPDHEIFDEVLFDAELIASRLETKAFLNKGLRIVFRDRATDAYYEFKHDGGVSDFLDHMVKRSKQAPVHTDKIVVAQEDLSDNVTRLELAVQWTEDTADGIETFVNGVPTPFGGTHEQGFKDGLNKALRDYFSTHNIAPKSLSISPDDIREGVKAIVSVFMRDPDFQGQTKEKLNNQDVRSTVSGALRVALEQHLHMNSSTGNAIAQRIIQAAKARAASRSAVREVRRKTPGSRRLTLPGKLADCSSSNPELCELFIVEGDSAGGNAKQGRMRETQAILPLRGKVLNAEQATWAKIERNKELRDVVDALGCGMGEAFDADKLRYHKIILLMDADSDGQHISTLLLTFFYRYMPELISGGYLYIAQPPLFRVDWGEEIHWVLDERERDRLIRELEGRNERNQRKRHTINIQRFKGLGEMMARTLKETTLAPEQRRLLKVVVHEEDEELTDTTISDLMGRDASVRFEYIMSHAADVEDLDI